MSEPFFKESDCDFMRKQWGARDDAISLDKANALLQERGTVVVGHKDGSLWYRADVDEGDEFRFPHRALLIQIEPLVRDSVEKLIADLLKAFGLTESNTVFGVLIDRARKLQRGEK